MFTSIPSRNVDSHPISQWFHPSDVTLSTNNLISQCVLRSISLVTSPHHSDGCIDSWYLLNTEHVLTLHATIVLVDMSGMSSIHTLFKQPCLCSPAPKKLSSLILYWYTSALNWLGNLYTQSPRHNLSLRESNAQIMEATTNPINLKLSNCQKLPKSRRLQYSAPFSFPHLNMGHRIL